MKYILALFVVAATMQPSCLFSQTIRINEVSPANATLQDEDGEVSDWIELYNPSASAVSLKGWRISDKNDRAKAWVFPDTSIAPGAFLLVRASGLDKVGSGLICVEGAGAGINPWNTWDAFHYLYYPVQGDFDVSMRIHSLQMVDDHTKVGLMWVDKPQTENLHAGMFATGRDVFVFSMRPVANVAPTRATELGLPIELPDTWVRLRRKGDSVFAYASLRGDYWEPVDSSLCPPIGPNGFIGIALGSYSDTVRSRATISDLKLNNESLTLDMLTPADIGTKVDGRYFISREMHTNFELKDEGESLFLWNDEGQRVDSLTFGSVRANMTYGRAADRMEYFGEATPLAANTSESGIRITGAPTFSPAGGKYDGTVSVSIGAASSGDRIFYTTNGSEPTTLSAEYTGVPIVVASTATLRARAFAGDALPGAVATTTYLIGESTHLPIVALATDPDNLWGKYGIFEHVFLDVEIPLHMEFWDGDGALQLNLDAGAKTHGRITRTLPQKSLRLYARSRYGVKDFDYPMFPSKSIKSYDRLLLRNSGQDWYSTMIRDAVFASIVSELSFDVQAYRPAVVFINGEYWGLCNVRERVDEKFVEQNHDVDADSIDMLEEAIMPRTGSSFSYHTMVDSLAKIDMKEASSYAYADSLIDLQNFADYMISEIFVAAGDWPQYNQRFWRERKAGGRWRWIMSDVDMGLGLDDDTTAYRKNRLEIATSPVQDAIINPPYSTFLLRTMIESPRFRNDFINRTADILNTTLHSDRMILFIDSLAADIANEVPRHVMRWDTSLANWNTELEKMEYFVTHRHKAVREHYIQKFELSGNALVTLATTQPGTGTIRFSTVLPPALPWTGVYFKDVPITATAMAAPGYKFLKWNNPGLPDTSTVTITLTGDTVLTAVFVPEGTTLDDGVVINEIMYKPADDLDSKDWIELHNIGAWEVNISGWKLKDDDDEHGFVIPAGTVIPAKGYVLLCNDTKAFRKIYPVVQAPLIGDVDFGFGTPSDQVRLYDEDGILMDSVLYDMKAPWPTNASGTGRSIELLNPALDNTLGQHWQASEQGGTPGESNGTGTGVELSIFSPFIGLECYPNPVEAGTTVLVRCQPKTAGRITLSVVDAVGKEIRELRQAGDYTNGELLLPVNTTSLPPGMYFLRVALSASEDGATQVLPLVVVK